ncbi:hypothetical protein [Ferrimonas pelagia]|uniref:Uncharacterized protein n=1 Tax=Ferrimonas pelagia TaxID=1177826 RepID=A0ABP9F497_9GAMM
MRKHPVSARLDDADYDFLMGIEWNGATTQSEKLRELISFAKLYAEGQRNKEQALALADQLMAPLRQHLAAQTTPTPLLQQLSVHLPALIAPALLPQQDSADSEAQILRASEAWLDTLLRLTLTDPCPGSESLSQARASLAGLAQHYLKHVASDAPVPQ